MQRLKRLLPQASPRPAGTARNLLPGSLRESCGAKAGAKGDTVSGSIFGPAFSLPAIFPGGFQRSPSRFRSPHLRNADELPIFVTAVLAVPGQGDLPGAFTPKPFAYLLSQTTPHPGTAAPRASARGGEPS